LSGRRPKASTVANDPSPVKEALQPKALLMLILTLDTATAICAAGLYDAHKNIMVTEISETIGIGHAEKLMAMVESVLASAKIALADIGLVAANIGPGSFTGVRTGLAAAQGLVQALGIPGAGVSALEAVASDARLMAPDAFIRVLINANRGEVHAQDFAAGGAAISDPHLISIETAAEGAERFVLAGNGSGLVTSALTAETGATISKIVLPDAATSSLISIARLAHHKWLMSQSGKDASLTLSPLYLRGADAKPQTGFALART
jgi:tRNA threonylcarbamoyladenosine biosynthesis protein TsaB